MLIGRSGTLLGRSEALLERDCILKRRGEILFVLLPCIIPRIVHCKIMFKKCNKMLIKYNV